MTTSIILERDEINSKTIRYKYLIVTTLFIYGTHLMSTLFMVEELSLLWITIAVTYNTYAYLTLDRYINFRIFISSGTISFIFDNDIETFHAENIHSIKKTRKGYKITVRQIYGIRFNTEKEWFRLKKTYTIDTDYFSQENKLKLESYLERLESYDKNIQV